MTPYRSYFWYEGAHAALDGVPRERNPYPTFSESDAWEDWNAGWDDMMKPYDDERAGGGPL